MRLRTRKSDVPEGAMVPPLPEFLHAVARTSSIRRKLWGRLFGGLFAWRHAETARCDATARWLRAFAHWVKVKTPAESAGS